MRKSKNIMSVIIWFVVICSIGNIGIVSRLFSGNSAQLEPVTEDTYMTTNMYHTDIDVQEDNSYVVSENINVEFQSYRHGIYRYVPYKGIITEEKEDGTISDIPYYGAFSKMSASEELDVSSENGNKVFRLGEEDTSVTGVQNYSLSYKVKPTTSKGYQNAYYNVFPIGWRNEIPAGSGFTIHFPKEIDTQLLKLYYGPYGSRNDASEITELTWEDTTVSGVLKESLPVGYGLSFYVPMEAGYFQNVATVWSMNLPLLLLDAMIFVVLLVLFFLFGRDEQIIPSIQFQPPAGLDSAAVGYIIDGSVSDQDMISLFIFWADRGFIKIKETKKGALRFIMVKELPEDTPAYARTLFESVFGKGSHNIGKEIPMSSLKYKVADAFSDSKGLLKQNFGSKVYTMPSKVARICASVLSMIPILVFCVMLYEVTFTNMVILLLALIYLIGVFIFNSTVDYWYSIDNKHRKIRGSASAAVGMAPLIVIALIHGPAMLRGSMLNLFPAMLGMVAVSVCTLVLTGFMKKRTAQCVEWMGYLSGLRDFIETAELERMQVIAKDSPELFYHILPFAYVFGLSDILLDKMKDLTIPAPDWYESPNMRGSYFDYYLMHHMLHSNLHQASVTIATPKPPQSSGRSGLGGGGLGGGFGGGGGFSGGGFGGGGGGSW